MINFQQIFNSDIKDQTKEVEWLKPSFNPFERMAGIHVWKVKWTDISSQRYLSLLSKDEYDKILRYRNNKDRNKRLISRGILKELAAGYLKTAPKTLTCESNRYGKPYFSNPLNHLQFNISHSTDYILIAFCFDKTPIGIDIEENNLLFNYLDIADQYFSDDEKESLACDAPSEQFFKIWTRKEALVKSIGEGLTDDLIQISVLEKSINLSDFDNQTFFLKTFKTDEKFLFSIAAKKAIQEIQFFDYLNF